MAGTHIFIVTPCYGGMVTAAYASSVSQFEKACQVRGISTTWLMITGHAMITLARAEMVAAVLEAPEATHLLSIDADIAFKPDQVFRLLDFGAPFVGAVYPYKTINWAKATAAFKDGKSNIPSVSLDYVVNWADEQRIDAVRGFARAKYIGAGFMLLQRSVLDALRTAHPELRYHYRLAPRGDMRQPSEPRPPDRYGLFEPIVDKDGAYLPEDHAFCRRWTELGGEIWVDLASRVDHLGIHTFSGDLSTQLISRKPD